MKTCLLEKTFLYALFSLAIVAGSCDTTTEPGGGTTLSLLTADPDTLFISINEITTSIISGGKKPYSIDMTYDTNKIGAAIMDSTLWVIGRAKGLTKVTVRDSVGSSAVSIPVFVDTGTVTPPTPSEPDILGSWTGTYTFTTGTLAGQTFAFAASISKTGNTYSGTFTDVSHSISWTLNSISFSGQTFHAVLFNTSVGTLTVDGTLSGNTMTGTFTDMYGSGTFSLTRPGTSTNGGIVTFFSTKGNFSATGNYDSVHFVTNVGAFNFLENGRYYLVIVAVHVISSSLYETASLTFSNSTAIDAGVFMSFPRFFNVIYSPPKSTGDTAHSYYLCTGTGTISSFTSTTAEGTFFAKGYNNQNNNDTVTVTSGTFTVNYEKRKPWGLSHPDMIRMMQGLITREIFKRKTIQ